MDPELFFPDWDDTEAVANARAVCETCPVACQCLAYALSQACFYDSGILGGTTAPQRRRMRRGWWNMGRKGAA